MLKSKYKKLICAFTSGFRWSSLKCVIQVLFDKKGIEKNETTGIYEVVDESGGDKRSVLESVAILGNTVVQIDFTVARVAESFSYFDGTITQNDTVPGGGVWTIPNTVSINTIETADGNIFNLENADQDRIWSTNNLNETLDILNVTIISDIVTDNRFRSFANEFGYKLLGSEIIPPLLVNDKVVSASDGSVLTYKGKVPYNTKIVDSNQILATGIETLTNPNISGWTVKSWIGTSTPSISTTTISLTAGTLSHLILNDGSEDHPYPISEGDAVLIEDTHPTNPQHLTINTATLATFWDLENARPDNLLDGFSQKLVNNTLGFTSIQNTIAYGIYQFTSNTVTAVITINLATTSTNRNNSTGYEFSIQGANAILIRWDAGSSSSINNFGGGLIANTKYTHKIIRLETPSTLPLAGVTVYPKGTFAWYIKGGQYGDTFVMLDSPVTDDTYSSFSYINIESLAPMRSQNIKNFLINDIAIDILSSVDGTGTYYKVRIPAISTTLDVEGDELSNPSGKWYNGAESELLDYPSYAIRNADEALTTPIRTDGSGNFVKVPYSTYNNGDGNFENIILYRKDPIKQIVTFVPDSITDSPDCFVEAALRLDRVQALQTSELNPVKTSDGKDVYVLKKD